MQRSVSNLPCGQTMKLQSLFLRTSLLLFAAILSSCYFAPRAGAQSNAQAAAAVQSPAVPARITQAIDETQLVRLKGNVHPLARAEFDQGAVSTSLHLERMLLILRRSPEQETALRQLMVDQYNTASPNYHKWLTPEQFGAQFGPADTDIHTVTSWLQSHGFQVAKVTKGKIAIEFSGTATQVNQAFRTEIHKFLVNGKQHLANAADPQIPAALAPLVLGLAPLNDFRSKPMHRVVGEFSRSPNSSDVTSVRPEFTTSGGNFAIGPADFATIYNVLPLWNAATPIDGTGQSVAVVGVSNINLQDVADFRTLFGLSTGGTAVPQVIIDGADPGIVPNAETEALLDTEWSGAVAKGAQIHLVIAADTDIADGLVLAMFHVVDNNSDPALSVSFGNCESNLGTNGNNLLQLLWEQAAAQGITVTVSSGDEGSAGCEDQNALAPNPATTGLQVSGFASTPFNVAVGGTDFNDNTTQSTYFKPNAQNDPNTLASAISYIPEATWNESCTNSAFNVITGLTTPEANCNSTNAQAKAAVITAAGSGGKSAVYTAKPAFQSFISAANGMPADGARDLPDVSLFAGTGLAGDNTNPTPLSKSFYVVCEVDAVSSPSCQKGGTFHFLGVGGTSASAPSFAGLMALVNQKTGQRQGNANFVLYKLAQQQFQAGTACASVANPLPNAACTFNDVTTGTIAMPCSKGSLNCTTTVATDTIGVLSGFDAGAGYDLATGLGSVNANNLINKWSTGATAFTATSTTLSLSPTTPTAESNVTVNITVTPQSGTAKPTGDVALISTAANGQGVDGFTLDANGQVANKTTNQLTGGTYQVTARYGGDATFAPSISTPVSVTVSPTSSTTVASVLAAGAVPGTFVTFTSGQAPVTLFLQASINPNGTLLATGTVNFVDTFNGTQTTVAGNVGINSAGEAFTASGISTFAPGSHSIVAQYSGDPSFMASNSAAVTFTLTAPGSFTVGGSAATVTAGSNATSTITVTPTGGFTGMVNVTCAAANLPPGVSCTPNPLGINVTGTAAVTGNLTVAVAAPSSSTSASNLPADRTLQWATLAPIAGGGKGWWRLSAVTGFAAILLLLLAGRKRYRTAVSLGLICILSFTLGCSSGYGGGGGGTSSTTTKISVTSTKVASGTSVAFNVTVTSTGTRTPTGSVQLYDGTAILGTAGTLANGSATVNISTLSVGTHAISAHYLADAYSTASQSGVLNVAITGSTTFAITASPAASNGSPTVNLTIN